jgi:uncharacterized protein YbjT (DUF2867 family)
MSPRIFITGVSGYIGGHVAGVIVDKHPEYELAALVRNEEQAQIIGKTWPSVETIIGDLDSHEILLEQGAKADVVLRKHNLFLCCCSSSSQLLTGCDRTRVC